MRYAVTFCLVSLGLILSGAARAEDGTAYDISFAPESYSLSPDVRKQLARLSRRIEQLNFGDFAWVLVGQADPSCAALACPKQVLLRNRADAVFAALVEYGLPVRQMAWQPVGNLQENQLSIRASAVNWQKTTGGCEAEVEISDSRWPLATNGEELWLPLSQQTKSIAVNSRLRLPALSGWDLTVLNGNLKKQQRTGFFALYSLAASAELLHFKIESLTAVRTVGDIPLEWPELSSSGNSACIFSIDVERY